MVIAGVILFDVIANWGRAYGNISVNGVAVGGMNREEMTQVLEETFGTRVSHAQVSIYPNETARQEVQAAIAEAAQYAEGSSDEPLDIHTDVKYWTTDALSLHGSIPYDAAIDEALAIGRGEGGIAARFSLMADPVDIPLGVDFDAAAVDSLAASIDEAIGEPRKDTSITIIDAYAYPEEGHDGRMVNREWFADQLSWAMIEEVSPSSFIAQLEDAPSRITMDQAVARCAEINHALGCDAIFTYKENTWKATDIDLGDWTLVETVPVEGGYELGVSIDGPLATQAVMKGAKARVTADDTAITLDETADDIIVYTSGEGLLPLVPQAVQELNDALYGPGGIAWTDEEPHTLYFDIQETDKPERLTFEEARELEILSIIGEFTTEFSNEYGTENRNHNIKRAADILNNRIIEADGGIWSFNDESGDTNDEAGFWTAGSIVNGEIIDSVGGGICQVATTVYNAVYEAGLDIPERHNHTLYLANYPDGRDAMVNYPDIDLIWRNNLPSDVLLRLSYTDTSVTATLYSVYTGITVETQTGDWKDGKKYEFRFEEDKTYAKGAYVKKVSGEDGREISVTRIVKDKNGNVIGFEVIGSVYLPQDEIYKVGPGTDTEALEKELMEALNGKRSSESDEEDEGDFDEDEE